VGSARSISRPAVYHQAVTEHSVARTPQWVLNVWDFWYAHVPAKASTHLMKQASSKQINLQGAVRGVSRIWVSHLQDSATTVWVVSRRKDCQTHFYRLYSYSVRVLLIQAAPLMLQNLSLFFTSGLWLLVLCKLHRKEVNSSEVWIVPFWGEIVIFFMSM